MFQWHPAKPQFEWSRAKDIKHTQEAILAGQYWADFFVNQGNYTLRFDCQINSIPAKQSSFLRNTLKTIPTLKLGSLPELS